jgi:hypothetical protein
MSRINRSSTGIEIQFTGATGSTHGRQPCAIKNRKPRAAGNGGGR